MKILTFDVEDWFHILDNDLTKTETEWINFDSRVAHNMQKIFTLLENKNLNATFFVLGWIAEKYPEIVKEIDNRGFDIGTHSHMHQLIYTQSKTIFKNDLIKSISVIENITGKKVKSFRAPGFSITENSKWAFEILCDQGIEIDCSLFPANRAHGGLPSFKKNKPCLINFHGHQIKEFPINTNLFFGKPIIFSGGGYFRLLPYSYIKHCTMSSDYVMSYFHPRDFDPDQPQIPGLKFFRRFKSTVGLRGCEKKLRKWVSDFDFINLSKADQQINWNEADEVIFS